MKYAMATAVVLSTASSGAIAGGIERSPFSSGFLFEEGSYAEFSFGAVNPSVSGTATVIVPGNSSGDMAPSFTNLAFAYKRDINDEWSFGLTLNEPIGADVAYPLVAYPFAGAVASVDSLALTGLLKYSMQNNVSVYGGLRVQKAEGNVSLPGPYVLSTSAETDLGYILGVAWEKPEIAARVALTYQSEITHDFSSLENGSPTAFSTTIPQVIQLEFQSGIAENTLLFGSVQWAEWSEFDISPPGFAFANGGASLVDITTDSTTFNLGIGRRFNETWSGAVTLGYEKPGDVPVGNLVARDGFASIGLAATYTNGPTKITAGVRYIDVGDATTTTIGSNFSGNKAIAAGIRVGYSF